MKMCSKTILCLVLCFVVSTAFAQQPPDHIALTSPTWEAFGELSFHVKYKDGKNSYTPVFPAVLQPLDKKKVILTGYMVPIRAGMQHADFMLSVLPVAQCAFCGSQGIAPMVEVNMKEGKKIYFSDEPITIEGTVHLNAAMDGKAEIQILDALEK